MISYKWIENEKKIPTRFGYYPTQRKWIETFKSNGVNLKHENGLILLRKPKFIIEDCDSFLEVNLIKAFQEGVKIAYKNEVYLVSDIRPEHIVSVIEKT
jgi:hypothetical protein